MRNFPPEVVEKQSGITLENKIEVGDLTNKGSKNGELCPPKDFKDK